MSQFLSTLGGLALGGCAGILLLALAGRSTRTRWAARWRCWLWLLLCLRLAVPLPLLPQRPDSAPIQVPLPPAVTAPARPVSWHSATLEHGAFTGLRASALIDA